MEKQNQMQAGAWDRISPDIDGKEKVKFEVNIPQKLTITNPVPKELTGEDGGIYYAFEVKQDEKDKVLNTSSWTLLRELKRLGIKSGMTLEIVKKLEKGKQFFSAKIV